METDANRDCRDVATCRRPVIGYGSRTYDLRHRATVNRSRTFHLGLLGRRKKAIWLVNADISLYIGNLLKQCAVTTFNRSRTFSGQAYRCTAPNGLFPLRLRVALRDVAWRAIITSAMKRVEALQCRKPAPENGVDLWRRFLGDPDKIPPLKMPKYSLTTVLTV